MRPLRYSINVSLDGCCDHQAIPANQELHEFAARSLNRSDALLFGRVIYQMMEGAFRHSADLNDPFVQMINAKKKYVVSTTLDHVDWNAQLIHGDLRTAVEQLKQQSGSGIAVGGVQLPLALAEMGLIDEYEFVVHPIVIGRGPSLLAGLSKAVELELVGRQELASGAVALQYRPKK